MIESVRTSSVKHFKVGHYQQWTLAPKTGDLRTQDWDTSTQGPKNWGPENQLRTEDRRTDGL